MTIVRVCVCGDEGCGKSSLITALVKDTFVTNKIQATLPQITIPPTIGTPKNVSTTIVDTSALPQERTSLNRELRKCNIILLLYSDNYSYERVALFWLPHFRSLGISVPVVLCAAKADLYTKVSTEQVVNDEMLPVMAEFREIDSCIRVSSREHHNVNEAFFLCQKAVTDPIAPLFDSKESRPKPVCTDALKRIFYLCDKDKNGYWSDEEINAFQIKCFERPLANEELVDIKTTLSELVPSGVTAAGISQDCFVRLCSLFAEKGRHETIWRILRSFNYTDSLSLSSTYLSPRFDVPSSTSSELSPAGYRFFVDLFLLFDKDTDGGLSPSELDALFAPAPGLPPSWLKGPSAFPSATTRNEAGHVTLQGWLAQWALTTFFHPSETLYYLACLGYDPPSGGNITSALTTTKPRKRPPRYKKPALSSPPAPRSVFQAYILGPPNCGKSSLLNTFLNLPSNHPSQPPPQPRNPTDTDKIDLNTIIRHAVNSVELPGGKQVTLILSEISPPSSSPSETSSSPTIPLLNDPAPLSLVDLLVFTYDASSPTSFPFNPHLQNTHPLLSHLPELHLALQADKDKARQEHPIQPEEWCEERGVQKPVHVSVKWQQQGGGMMIGEVFAKIAEGAVWPAGFYPRKVGEEDGEGGEGRVWLFGSAGSAGGLGVWVGAGVVVAAMGVGLGIWKRLYP